MFDESLVNQVKVIDVLTKRKLEFRLEMVNGSLRSRTSQTESRGQVTPEKLTIKTIGFEMNNEERKKHNCF